MSRVTIERRLTEIASRLRSLRTELEVADEQVRHFAEIADETRLRSLVSETPLAGKEHAEAERHATAIRRHRDDVAREITELEQRQDELLDRLLGEP